MFLLVVLVSNIQPHVTKVFARCFQKRKWAVLLFAQTEIKVFRKLVLLTAKAPENRLKPERKGSSTNHLFRLAMSVLRSVAPLSSRN